MKRIGDLERKYVNDVLSHQFSTSSGSTYMTLLEKEFARRYGVKYAISFVNGTATMHAALEAAGVGAGDEVIVPPLTMSSTSLAVLHCNATPVFADIDPETFLIDPSSIKECITSKTKAIISVALYGLSPDAVVIREIADQNNLFFIEDNAQAFLSYCGTKLAGTMGHCASFSFQSSKHITSGEGGILITDDEELAVRVRKYGGLGYSSIGAKKAKISKDDIQHPTFKRHDTPGWNYRMGELNCAVAYAQVQRMQELVDIRVRNANMLVEALDDCKWLNAQLVPKEYASSFWTVAAILDTKQVPWDKFRQCFLSNGGDKFYGSWSLTYLEPLFVDGLFGARKQFIKRSYKAGLCPIAEDIQPRLIQFKTNYLDVNHVKQQALILKKTISELTGVIV